MIIQKIEAGSDVIDIGCGTGALAFDLSEKCHSITGVELSAKMHTYAKRKNELRKQKNGKQNIHFVYGNGANLADIPNQKYNYTVISMAIHEMSPALRLEVLREAKRVGEKVIIGDYTAPQPLTMTGIIVRLGEFFAGIEHFMGFRNFQKNNGIDGLLKTCRLSIIDESVNQKGTLRVVVVQ